MLNEHSRKPFHLAQDKLDEFFIYYARSIEFIYELRFFFDKGFC